MKKSFISSSEITMSTDRKEHSAALWLPKFGLEKIRNTLPITSSRRVFIIAVVVTAGLTACMANDFSTSTSAQALDLVDPDAGLPICASVPYSPDPNDPFEDVVGDSDNDSDESEQEDFGSPDDLATATFADGVTGGISLLNGQTGACEPKCKPVNPAPKWYTTGLNLVRDESPCGNGDQTRAQCAAHKYKWCMGSACTGDEGNCRYSYHRVCQTLVATCDWLPKTLWSDDSDPTELGHCFINKDQQPKTVADRLCREPGPGEDSEPTVPGLCELPVECETGLGTHLACTRFDSDDKEWREHAQFGQTVPSLWACTDTKNALTACQAKIKARPECKFWARGREPKRASQTLLDGCAGVLRSCDACIEFYSRFRR
jgi:hypothetical protein